MSEKDKIRNEAKDLGLVDVDNTKKHLSIHELNMGTKAKFLCATIEGKFFLFKLFIARKFIIYI